ncbi:ATP-dependent DNA helicase RecG [bacterium]|nr:MAG: ATP-dependent DNA helicase RecG [bacterium]
MNTESVSAMNSIGIFDAFDLLKYFPRTYMDTRNVKKIKDIEEDENCSFIVKVTNNKLIRTKYGKSFVLTQVEDEDYSKAEIYWFNQTFMLKALEVGEYYIMYGKLAKNSTLKLIKLQISEFEKLKDGRKSMHLAKITPIYRETKGISSKLIRSKILYILKELSINESTILSKANIIPDHLSTQVRIDNNLINYQTAISNIHFPKSFDMLDKAKRRLGFDEIYHILKKAYELKSERTKIQAVNIKFSNSNFENLSVKEFLYNLDNYINLPFQLTKDQQTSLEEILTDIAKSTPMSRLLQGEVGSGKTILSAIVSFLVLQNSLDVAFLCPTTLLAKQHYESFVKFKDALKFSFDFDINLVTSIVSKSKVSKIDKKNDKSKRTPTLFIGTHAILYQAEERLSNVGLVIIDEQHRFGVEQREKLLKFEKNGNQNSKKFVPHYLMMTATPIPRSIGEVYFADLDISRINSLPSKRIPISSYVVPENKRVDSYSWMKNELQNGGQAYIICPIIEESETLDLKNVKKEYEVIKGEFENFKVALLHGKLKESEKQDILERFNDQLIDILVTTQVIEVGIDIPNANIIVIESAERFGLAQLHQLRGRVGRGDRKSYCLLFKTPSNSTQPADDFEISEKEQIQNLRLEYFSNHSNGMELAEYDMLNRGVGDIAGLEQSGIPKFKFADIMDLELVKQVKKAIKNE